MIMKVLTIAFYDLIKLLRERTALLIMILVPIVFTLLMGLAFGNTGSAKDSDTTVKIPVGIANLDQGPVAKELIIMLNEDKTIKIAELTESELLQKVKNADIELGFVIPENFSNIVQTGKQPEVQTLRLPNSVDYMAIQNIISTAFARLRVKAGTEDYFTELLTNLNNKTKTKTTVDTDLNKNLLITDISTKISENLQKPDLVTVEVIKNGKQIVNKSVAAKSQISIGILVMFVMFSVIFSAGEVLEEKKVNTWGRLTTTPTFKYQVILGKILGTFLKGWVQIGLLIIFGVVFMGVSWGNSIYLSLLVLSVYLLAIIGLGLLLSALVKTNSQLGAYSAILIVCTSMLSGCYWPVELEPVLMQKIAAFFPQYWAIKALSNTVGLGLGIESVIEPVLVLLVMTVVFFVLNLLAGSLKVGFKRNSPPRAWNEK
ncbi:MAG: ABC transporter permease [Desulfitobacteriaceae bacterium]